jgi:hypothetical protein
LKIKEKEKMMIGLDDFKNIKNLMKQLNIWCCDEKKRSEI